MTREMVAIIPQQIIATARKPSTYVLKQRVDFRGREVCEALEKRAAERAAWRLEPRAGPEDAGVCGRGRTGRAGNGAIGVLAVVEDDAGVDERETKRPEQRGERAGREEIVDIDYDFGFGEGAGGSGWAGG